MERIHDIYRPADERTQDWREVERDLTDAELKEQTSRCMNCGQPFCHAYGCPLGNLVPDQNRAVAQGDWCRAYALLSANSDFPEFTSRVCPALCEANCVHGLDEEAAIVRQSEKRIVETAFANGWVVPRPPAKENGKSAAVVVAIGTPAARDLKIPGRDLAGVHLALELLEGQNRFLTGELPAPPVDAHGRDVLVIGGGDTGSDCVGTAIRHGAKSVTQIEIMPRPPDAQDESTPWPLWPYQLRTSSSHKEGCKRRWNLNSLRFTDDGAGRVSGVEVETVEWEFSPEGRPLKFRAVPDTRETIAADLVLLAMGSTGVPTDSTLVAQLGLKQTPRTALVPAPERNVFCVGDCASGASLVVRALASGKNLPL